MELSGKTVEILHSSSHRCHVPTLHSFHHLDARLSLILTNSHSFSLIHRLEVDGHIYDDEIEPYSCQEDNTGEEDRLDS